MIRQPRIGQAVRLHYRTTPRGGFPAPSTWMPYHGSTGIVRIVSRGPGPRNVGVEIGGKLVVVPRGNLVAE